VISSCLSIFLSISLSLSLSLSLSSQLYRVDVPMRDMTLGKDPSQEQDHSPTPQFHSPGHHTPGLQSRSPSVSQHDHDPPIGQFIFLLLTSHSSSLTLTAYYEIIDEMSRLLEGDAASHFGPISKMKIYPPKPMILFPALPANVRIYFTVSEVCFNPLVCFVSLHSSC
jgi:hypothetical protein